MRHPHAREAATNKPARGCDFLIQCWYRRPRCTALRAARGLVAALLLYLVPLAGCAASGTVIPSLGGGTPITVYERLPAGEGPFPAVVLLHGCDGGKRSDYSWAGLQRHADSLNELGIAALLVDSFSHRNVTAMQSCRNAGRYIGPRVRDAFAALRYLQDHPRIIGGRIGVQGASQGGTVVLLVVSSAERYVDLESGPGFAAGLAFYPYCDPNDPPPPPRVPLLILIGSEDDWTPAPYCERFVERYAGHDPAPRIAVLEGAHHSFDLPGLPLQEFAGHTVGADPGAYREARRRQREFFRAHLVPE